MDTGNAGGWPNGFDPKTFKTNELAGRVMAAAAESVSHMADTFSNWMLGGFGAVLALLFANLDRLASIIPLATMKRAGLIYIAAAALGVVEKLMALWSDGAAKGMTTGADFTKDLNPADFDLPIYIETVRRGLLRIWRRFLNKVLAAIAEGDITYVSRMSLKMAQWQVVIAMTEAILIVAAAAVLVSSL